MIQVTTVGNLTADPVSRLTQTGDTVCSFTLACRAAPAKRDETIFIRVSAWGKRGELIQQYCHKGSKLAVIGLLQPPTTYQKQTGETGVNLDVRLEMFEFCDSKSDGPAPAGRPVQASGAYDPFETPY